jgi:hypothetical protein
VDKWGLKKLFESQDTNFEEAEVAFTEADVDGPKEAKIGDYQTRLSMLRVSRRFESLKLHSDC